MRVSALFLLPLLVAAQQQPLLDQVTGWVNQAKGYLPGAKSPLEAAAERVTAANVEKITQSNWQTKLAPKAHGPEEWMVYMTGGNKSCHGRCDQADQAWNLAVPLISTTSSPPHLAYIDCEKEEIICTAWGAAVPHIWWFSFPQASTSDVAPTPETPLYILPINYTTVTPETYTRIVTDKHYLKYPEYKGAFHPIDGLLIKYQVLMPLGYVLWAFGTTPSWLLMIGISFFSRQMVSKRAMNSRGVPSGPGQQPAQPARAPARAPAPAPAANPRTGAGAGRKRK